VTGGAGFVGSHLCGRLLAEGHAVLCADNLVTGSEENVAHLRGDPGFEFVDHDVAAPMDPRAVTGPLEVVYHFASPASPKDFGRVPVEILKAGSFATHNLLELAREKGARFVLASTSEVYGNPLVHPQDEDYLGNVDPVGPRGVYDEAKRYAEAATMAYHRHHGLATRIVRIFNTHGPRMRPDDGRMIPNFIGQALRDEPLTVYGDGSQTRSVQYVDDLIEGVLRLAASGETRPVNIGNPVEYTVRGLAELILELSGSASELVSEPLPADDPKQRRPDISRAREVLGWEPRVGAREGLEKTLSWFAGREELVRGAS
jgi:dTDP-glucose 4,6-dehydratase